MMKAIIRQKPNSFRLRLDMGGHLFRNWTGELCHKKAHEAQKSNQVHFVPYVLFCG